MQTEPLGTPFGARLQAKEAPGMVPSVFVARMLDWMLGDRSRILVRGARRRAIGWERIGRTRGLSCTTAKVVPVDLPRTGPVRDSIGTCRHRRRGMSSRSGPLDLDARIAPFDRALRSAARPLGAVLRRLAPSADRARSGKVLGIVADRADRVPSSGRRSSSIIRGDFPCSVDSPSHPPRLVSVDSRPRWYSC
jgi:hypothetical protein